MSNEYRKADLLKEIAHRADFTIEDVKLIWNAFEQIVFEVIRDRGTIFVGGLFKISVGDIREHEGWDAYRSEPLHLPAANRIKFRASKSLLQLLKM